ncbi:uncharacterized protein VTP21DRAFT_7902 [Calcarisporiella thermophila]|uniref:uncharacterized protein n=1 Tax=Calcarisporiella thermophila TaxID=911321 RepID=UPI0037440E2B
MPQEFHGRDKSVEQKLLGKGSNFVDFTRIIVQGGKGGDGAVAFNREIFKPKGPPSGGNGGRGGNVIFIATSNESSLGSIPKLCVAGRGGNGGGKWMSGKLGEDLVVKVPLGTVVKEIDLPTNELEKNRDELSEEEKESELELERERRWVHYPRFEEQNVAGSYFREAEARIQRDLRRSMKHENKYHKRIDLDLTEEGEYIVARGGEGGYGNPHFLTNENRSPKFATRGQDGQRRLLELELRTIADAGLVGLPNAGKSSLLRAVSNAMPRVASYPFTTLNPYLGTIDFPDRRRITLADIPGLIRGAHRNIGLGHAFLRHIERNKVLVYVIDVAQAEPWRDWCVLREELELYSPGLTQRPSLIVANKADVLPVAKESLPRLREWIERWGNEEANRELPEIVPVSAKYRSNVKKLLEALRRKVELVEEQERKVNNSSKMEL